MALPRKMAATGRLRAFAEGDPELHLDGECGLHAVYKEADRDRLIVDALRANGHEFGLCRRIRLLGSACPLFEHALEADGHLSFYGEDVRDYYWQFGVTRARTARKLLVGSFSGDDVRNLVGLPVTGAGPFRLCLGALAMGDLNAVEFGQAAHLGVLVQAGVLNEESLVAQHRPLPRGDFGIGVVIDDLVGYEVVGPRRSRGELARRLAKARAAYVPAGLEGHQGKRVVAAEDTVIWGYHFGGKEGWVSAPPARLVFLTDLTFRVAKLGAVSVGP